MESHLDWRLCSRPHAFSNMPHANNTKHMVFLAAREARSYCHQNIFARSCEISDSSRPDGTAAVLTVHLMSPFAPGWLTWWELNPPRLPFFFLFPPAWTCLLLHLSVPLLFLFQNRTLSSLATLKAASRLRCICSPRSPSCQCKNKSSSSSSTSDNGGRPQTCSTPTNLPNPPPFFSVRLSTVMWLQ